LHYFPTAKGNCIFGGGIKLISKFYTDQIQFVYILRFSFHLYFVFPANQNPFSIAKTELNSYSITWHFSVENTKRGNRRLISQAI